VSFLGRTSRHRGIVYHGGWGLPLLGSMTHAVHYSCDQLIAWWKSVPLTDNVRARVHALKIRTCGCRTGMKLKLKRSLSCPGVTTSSNDTCGLIPVITGNRPTRLLSSYVMCSRPCFHLTLRLMLRWSLRRRSSAWRRLQQRQVPCQMSLSCHRRLHGHPVLHQPSEMLHHRHDSLCGLTKPRHLVSTMRHYRTMTHRAPSPQLISLNFPPLNQMNCLGFPGVHLFRRMIPPKSTHRFIAARRYPLHQQQNRTVCQNDKPS